MPKLRLLALALIVAWTTQSCKKDDNNNNNNNNNDNQVTCTPANITRNSIRNQEYLYDNSGKLERVNLYSEVGTLQFFYAVRYDGSGRINEIYLNDTSGKSKSVYAVSYNSDGTVSKVSRQDVGAGTDNNTTTYSYADGQVSKITEFYNGDEQDFKQYTRDANGNVTTIKTLINNPGGFPDLTDTEEITYDDKKAVPTAFDLIMNPAAAKHNILTYAIKDNNNTIDITNSYTATYTYDGNNLPQTSQRKYQDGTTKNFNFTYNCK